MFSKEDLPIGTICVYQDVSYSTKSYHYIEIINRPNKHENILESNDLIWGSIILTNSLNPPYGYERYRVYRYPVSCIQLILYKP